MPGTEGGDDVWEERAGEFMGFVAGAPQVA